VQEAQTDPHTKVIFFNLNRFAGTIGLGIHDIKFLSCPSCGRFVFLAYLVFFVKTTRQEFLQASAPFGNLPIFIKYSARLMYTKQRFPREDVLHFVQQTI
jgi:hypothetical protein